MDATSGELRLAMIGMIEGNGHPWSWSSIINGYDPVAMAACPFPVIPVYMGKQPLETVRIPGARVTHIWTDNPADAPPVAATARIENVVDSPTDVVGRVDAVIIATDDGDNHVARAAPFIEAGLPVFIDKPLAVNVEDLHWFAEQQRQGARILSSSGMRYAPEMQLTPEQNEAIGDLRWVSSFTCKSWERYGIHALEAVYPLLGPGFLSVQTAHEQGSDIVVLHHKRGVEVTIAAIEDAYGSFGAVHLYGTKGHLSLSLKDTYSAFRAQLLAFVTMLQTGQAPFPFAETLELMAIIIAGRKSRDENQRRVNLDEVFRELQISREDFQ